MNTTPGKDHSAYDSINDIQFENVFNLEEIQKLQDLFSNASGVASIITHPDGTPITTPSNFCYLCQKIIRKTEKGLANCYQSDAKIGRFNPSGPIVWPCLSGGLWDAGASITVGGKHIANWMIGQVRNEALNEEQMVLYADEIGADKKEFRKALKEVPVMSLEKFNNVAKMLFAFTNEISEKGYNNLLLKKQIAERDKAIELLKETDEKHRLIFENVQEVFYQTDLEGIIYNISSSIKQFTGYEMDELIGTKAHHLYENLDDRNNLLEPLLKNGVIKDFEFKLRTKMNGSKHVSLNASLINNIEGKPAYIAGAIRDINDRKQAEEALSASRAYSAAILEKERTLMNSLMDNLPDRIYFKNLESKFIRVNKSMATKHGLNDSNSIEGLTDFDLFTNEHAIQAFNDEQEIIRTGNSIVNIEEKETYADGRITWAQTSKMPLFDHEGKIIGTFGISRDITKRKLAEEALKNSLYLTETILESIHNGILVVNHYGKVIKTNARFIKMWNIPEDVLDSKDDKKLINCIIEQLADPDEFITTIAELYENPEVESFDLIYFNDGRIFERISKPMDLEGEEKGRVWSFLDITGSKKNELQLQRNNEIIAAQNEEFQQINEEFQQINEELNHANFELIGAKEKAEESDRLKSAFLANMSHEIRTPMNGILGFADLLKEPELTGAERQEYISIIEKSGLRMLNIINDLIDISKVESGQMEIFISEINVNEQIEYIYNFFKPEVQKKGMHLFYRNGLQAEEAVIQSDREKLYAILVNLVKNAIKYSDTGSIEFGYSLNEKHLVFFIKDTGIGIPEDKKEAIFNRFIQADITDKRAFQGAGLGLAISKSYVEMLGGSIWVESLEGNGSTFYFTIPYNANHEELISERKLVSPEPIEHSLKKLKILVAEDDESSEKLLTEILKKYCKEEIRVNNGKDAVKTCKDNPDIDLIFMDIQLPDMNGYEATREIRKFNKSVLIIAQTAYALTGDRELTLKAGCNDYISKPIDKRLLKEMIQKYFND
jgi:PAS domain S-box-containing protein